MRCLTLLSTAFCLLVSGPLPSAAAQESTPKGEIEVDVRQPLQSLSLSTGFYPIVIEINNQSDIEHHLSIRIVRLHDNVLLVGTTLVVSSGERSEVELPVQVNQGGGASLIIESDAIGEINKSFLNTPQFTGGVSGNPTLFLMNEGEGADLMSNRGIDTSIRGGRILQPESCPVRWVSLTGLNCVCLTFDGFKTLDAVRRRAVLRYAESGGHLLICNADSDAATVIVELLDLDPPRTANEARPSHRYGLGWVIIDDAPPHSMESPDHPTLTSIITELRATGPRMSFRVMPKLHLPGIETVPARSFIVIVALFALLIGPINFYVLTRKKKRTLALMTIPLISIVATISLATYSFAFEGVNAKIVPRTVTHLDQRRHRYSQVANVGVFSGILTNGMSFSSEVAPFPTGFEQLDSWKSRPLPVSWDGGTQLAQSWLPSRTTTEFLLARNGPCRKRLIFQQDSDGEVTVGNALGVRLEKLFFCLGGKNYFTEPIDREETATAREYLRGTVEWDDVTDGISDALLDRPQPIFGLLQLELQPGRYIGRTGKAIINSWGLNEPEVLDGVNILTGRFDLEEK